MKRYSDETLRGWALTVDRTALMMLADEMPRVRSARKPKIIEWLLANDRERLTESYVKTNQIDL